jgi:N-acetylglucosamine malate deacetylase 1
MNFLVVSPHFDDETLGAGGTILKYKNAGHKFFWLNITNKKEEFGYKKTEVKSRNDEIKKVLKKYSPAGFYDLGLKPTGIDLHPISHLMEKITKIIAETKPNTVILPFDNDIHSDHKIISDILLSCTKTFRHSCIKKILMMEILSETNVASAGKVFHPDYFVDITDYLNKKIDIMKIYKGELKSHPFPRSTESIKALAVLRGSQAGCRYAEGFKTVKIIE